MKEKSAVEERQRLIEHDNKAAESDDDAVRWKRKPYRQT